MSKTLAEIKAETAAANAAASAAPDSKEFKPSTGSDTGASPNPSGDTFIPTRPMVEPSNNATMTTQSAAPKTREPKNFDPWEGAAAAPLLSAAMDQVKPKNKAMQLRWINRYCGEKTPYLRYEQALAQGWVACRPTDVEVIPPGCLKDDRIQTQDVILCMMPRAQYLGALRFNNERVNRAVTRSGLGVAEESLRTDFAKEGVSRKADGKVSVFVP
jgi:hypothetical protein